MKWDEMGWDGMGLDGVHRQSVSVRATAELIVQRSSQDPLCLS